jgi:hypothetical protein
MKKRYFIPLLNVTGSTCEDSKRSMTRYRFAIALSVSPWKKTAVAVAPPQRELFMGKTSKTTLAPQRSGSFLLPIFK